MRKVGSTGSPGGTAAAVSTHARATSWPQSALCCTPAEARQSLQQYPPCATSGSTMKTQPAQRYIRVHAAKSMLGSTRRLFRDSASGSAVARKLRASFACGCGCTNTSALLQSPLLGRCFRCCSRRRTSSFLRIWFCGCTRTSPSEGSYSDGLHRTQGGRFLHPRLSGLFGAKGAMLQTVSGVTNLAAVSTKRNVWVHHEGAAGAA